jgi:hypothetical protein
VIGKAIDGKTPSPKLSEHEPSGPSVVRLRRQPQQAPEGALGKDGQSSLELGATVVGHVSSTCDWERPFLSSEPRDWLVDHGVDLHQNSNPGPKMPTKTNAVVANLRSPAVDLPLSGCRSLLLRGCRGREGAFGAGYNPINVTREPASLCLLDGHDVCRLSVPFANDRLADIRGTRAQPFTDGACFNDARVEIAGDPSA